MGEGELNGLLQMACFTHTQTHCTHKLMLSKKRAIIRKLIDNIRTGVYILNNAYTHWFMAHTFTHTHTRNKIAQFLNLSFYNRFI